MNGTLALFVALASYGNEYLSKETPLHHLDFNNSTLIYCNTLEFTNINQSPSNTNCVIANNPQKWFKFLKSEGCKNLRIQFLNSNSDSQIDDFLSVGFVGGGGQWFLETVYGNYSNYWNLESSVTEPDSKDKRIWKEQFKIVKKNWLTSNLTITTENAKNDLLIALNEIEAFASRNKLNYWAETFRKAIENLNSSNPVVEYYKDFIVENQYTLQRKQLLFSASVANVFGGMGSWNDIMYRTSEENKTNNELSAKLYREMNQAIMAAVNNQ